MRDAAYEPAAFTLTVNGRPVRLEPHSPADTLLDCLRASGLKGTKEGCAEGDCGACTVVLVDQGKNGARYRAVNSCLLLAPQAAGQEVLTVEALAQGDTLHPVQEAMVRSGASQCGFCTPGFVMSLFAAYYDGSLTQAGRPPSVEAVNEALAGNLCRCTGYLPIRRAACSLDPPAPTDPFTARLTSPPSPPGPAACQVDGLRFERPTTLERLLEVRRLHPEARLVAGGTDLTLEVVQGRARPPLLLSVEAIPELWRIERRAEGIEVGAAVTLSRLEEELAGLFPALDAMLPRFGSRQVRNRATVGGNLMTASPIGDLAPVLLALDARAVITGPRGTRRLPLEAFFTGYRRTALAQDEVLRAVFIPFGPAAGAVRRLSRSYKVAKRGRVDISAVASAYTLDLDASGRVVSSRLAYGGVAPTPARAPAAETALLQRPWDEASLEAALEALATTFTPIGDHRGSAAFRAELIGNLFRRFFHETREEVVA